MKAKVLLPLAAVAGLFLLALLGAALGLGYVLGVVLPLAAAATFLAGMIYRVLSWVLVPVPFRIPTTCGQQRSLPWIRRARLDNPHTKAGVMGRMALEVLCFRSLLRNTKTQMTGDRRLVYGTDLSLWLAALVAHWSLLVILIRHLRLMTEPVPSFVAAAERVDGFLDLGLPVVFVSSLTFLAALAYLLYRRLAIPGVRYLSLASDYFVLFLLLGIGASGLWLRHVAKTDVVGIKELALGLVHLAPAVPPRISPLFFGHLFLVSVLAACFPFSKLVHMAGVFFSPTRNLANTNREARHVNPWDYPVKVHTYEEYEEELRGKMIGAGLPVEKR